MSSSMLINKLNLKIIRGLPGDLGGLDHRHPGAGTQSFWDDHTLCCPDGLEGGQQAEGQDWPSPITVEADYQGCGHPQDAADPERPIREIWDGGFSLYQGLPPPPFFIVVKISTKDNFIHAYETCLFFSSIYFWSLIWNNNNDNFVISFQRFCI